MIVNELKESQMNCWSEMDFEVVCPPILLLVLLLVASIGPIATFISLIVVLPVLLFKTHKYYFNRKRLKQTKFFLSWSISSLIVLISVFELQVVPYLEILFVENFILILLTSSALIAVIFIRKHDYDLNTHLSYDQNIYNFWIRSAVNQKYFVIYVLSQVLVLIALIYGSQLTLTTICHSSLVYHSILIPDDCSDVYIDYDIRMCFVCAIYSLQISFCLMFFLFKRLINWLINQKKPVIKYIRLEQIDP